MTPAKQETHYQTLEVDESASDEEIQKQYRRLAQELHPDTGSKRNEDRFKEVSNAYEELCTRRQEYDHQLAKERAQAAARARADEIRKAREKRKRTGQDAKKYGERIKSQRGASASRPPKPSPPTRPQGLPRMPSPPSKPPAPPSQRWPGLAVVGIVIVVIGIIAVASSGSGRHSASSTTAPSTVAQTPTKTPAEVQAEDEARTQRIATAKIAALSFQCIDRYICHADPENHRLPLFIDGMDENLRGYLEKRGYRDNWTDNAGGLDGQTIGPFASSGSAHTYEYVASAQQEGGDGGVETGMMFYELQEGTNLEDGSGTKPWDITGGQRWTITWTLRNAEGDVVKQLNYTVPIVACGANAAYCEKVTHYESDVAAQGESVAGGGSYSASMYTPPSPFLSEEARANAGETPPHEVEPQHESNLGPITNVTAKQVSSTKVKITWNNPHDPTVGGYLITENSPEAESSGFNTGPDPERTSLVEDTSQWEPKFRPQPEQLWQFCVAPFKRGLVEGKYVELPDRQDCTQQFRWH